MELIELKCDCGLCAMFNNTSSTDLVEFYITLQDSQFPNLRKNAAKVITMFGSTLIDTKNERQPRLLSLELRYTRERISYAAGDFQ